MTARRLGYGLWLCLAAGLYFFENNLGTRIVLIASLTLPALSILCAALAARRVSLSLEAPEQIRKRQTGECLLRQRGPGITPLWLIRLRLRARQPLTGEERPLMIPLRGKTAGFRAASDFCGCLLLLPEKAVLLDLFRLAAFPLPCPEAKTILVQPDLFPVTLAGDASAAGDAAGAEAACLPLHSGEADADLRPYVPGDPPGRIHWKLSAKVDQLLVRETRALPDAALSLLLETGGTAAPDAVDGCVEALLSVSRALADAGLAHQVCWQAEDTRRARVDSGDAFLIMRDHLLRTAARQESPGIPPLLQKATEPLTGRLLLFCPQTESLTPDELPRSARATLVLPRAMPALYPGLDAIPLNRSQTTLYL